MSMRVELQSLIPRVQDAEEADLRAQITRFAGHLQQRLRTGVKQQVEDYLFVLQRQWRQFTWHREDGVYVARGQEFSLPRREPSQPGIALAPRTMPIATRVERDGDAAAV